MDVASSRLLAWCSKTPTPTNSLNFSLAFFAVVDVCEKSSEHMDSKRIPSGK
ncbi:hypothetical protein KIN20_011767 [Parelaphostrongylus tenuis]|uniref:Uncharacterized protein n=1 Tax=Parelaphostrongylus tenuis TaxID=148309 RepID=A0AAD5M9Y6_PARTN|nr:hypothetical protein KIN20_011767 [Parelaphostrongylus tenuis]